MIKTELENEVAASFERHPGSTTRPTAAIVGALRASQPRACERFACATTVKRVVAIMDASAASGVAADGAAAGGETSAADGGPVARLTEHARGYGCGTAAIQTSWRRWPTSARP